MTTTPAVSKPTAGTDTRAVMVRLALSQLRRHPSRIVAVLLAVMISVGYLTATVAFLATETHAVGTQVSARTSGADVVVSTDGNAEDLQQPLGVVRTTVGVGSAELAYQQWTRIGGGATVDLQSVPSDPRLGWVDLSSGHWPQSTDQVVIGRASAKARGLGIGSAITIDSGSRRRTLTVSGIADETRALLSGPVADAFVTPAFFDHPDQVQADLLVIGDGSVGTDQLAQRIDDRLPSRYRVQTSQAYSEAMLTDLTHGADVFRNLLLIFGAIALLVGSILIVNTFLILLAQRRRQIGLLRAVGASAGQVRRSLLAEAVVTGVIGSVLGIGLGVGGTAIATAYTGSLRSGLVVPPTVLIAAGIGVLVTVFAALGPARRATRITPLEALRLVADPVDGRRSSLLTAVPAVLLAAAGGAVIIVGINQDRHALLLCVAGSLSIAVGVLVGVRTYFPLLLRLLGLLTRPLGPIGRLATLNTARNPGRAAATGAALMLATGLIVTLQVGAASVKASTNVALDQHYPVDVTLTGSGRPVPAELAREVAKVDGIAATATLRRATVTVRPIGRTGRSEATTVPLMAGDQLTRVINAGAGAVPADRLLLDTPLAKSLGIASSGRVVVGYHGRQRTMVAEPSRVAADGIGVVSPEVLQQIDPNAPVGAVWARAGSGADPATVQAGLDRIDQDHPDLQLSGSLTDKATYARLLDTLLLVATALLGVAVVIALLGVGNTLGLSVIERSRESALLRALGLQRGRLKLMLAVEAVLLAVTGAAVGIGVGAFFGWIGTVALSRELDYRTVVFSMSVPQTVAVAAVALVAGILASVLPGHRAARAAPVQALADV